MENITKGSLRTRCTDRAKKRLAKRDSEKDSLLIANESIFSSRRDGGSINTYSLHSIEHSHVLNDALISIIPIHSLQPQGCAVRGSGGGRLGVPSLMVEPMRANSTSTVQTGRQRSTGKCRAETFKRLAYA